VASSACIDLAGHDCTAIGCNNATTITLQAPNDAWAAGMYTLALRIDGTPGQCTMQVPDPPPVSGVQGSCGLGATATLTLATVDTCPPVVCKNGACEGMSCTPIPGRFQMVLVIQGLPTQVGLNLSVDGNSLMNQTIAPKSTTTQPNGAGCGTCTNGSATLSLPGG
jgi:hypothetical protein